jgi:teichoic acid transport system permease protein
VIVGGSRSLIKNRGLIRSISFPRAVLPLVVAVTETMAFVFPFIVMLLVAVASGVLPTWRWLVVIPIFAMQTLFAVGIGFVAARINFFFRDFENILDFLFRMAFYFSGVLFYVDRFVRHPTARAIADLNPLLDFISLYRWAVMDLPVTGRLVISSIAWTIGSLILGYLWFHVRERDYGRE